MKVDDGIRGVVERYAREMIDRLEGIGVLTEITNKDAEVRELSYAIRESLPQSPESVRQSIYDALAAATKQFFKDEHDLNLAARTSGMQNDISGIQITCASDILHYYKPENNLLHVEYGQLVAGFLEEHLVSGGAPNDCTRRDFIRLADQITALAVELANDGSLGEAALLSALEDQTREILGNFLVNCGAESDLNAARYTLRDWRFLDHLADNAFEDEVQQNIEDYRSDIQDVLMELVSQARPSNQLHFSSESTQKKKESDDSPVADSALPFDSYIQQLSVRLAKVIYDLLDHPQRVDDRTLKYVELLASELPAFNSIDEFEARGRRPNEHGNALILRKLEQMIDQEGFSEDFRGLIRKMTRSNDYMKEVISAVKQVTREFDTGQGKHWYL